MVPEDMPAKVMHLVRLLVDLVRGTIRDPDEILQAAAQIPQPSLQAVALVMSLLVFYNAAFVALMSATPGKYLCGLKVVSADLSRVSIAQAVARAVIPGLLLIADNFGLLGVGRLIVLVGYLMVAFDVEKRSLFDRFCRTRVVRR
jgi:uncharacterized RDD family membrane protein YckC